MHISIVLEQVAEGRSLQQLAFPLQMSYRAMPGYGREPGGHDFDIR